MRVKLTFSYDGTGFNGYQRQKEEVRTVQGELEYALLKLFDEAIEVHASGRTDSGVHARAQVAHFDLKAEVAPEKIVYALNRFLNRDIRVAHAEVVEADFHARKSAIGKHYSYRIYHGNRPSAIGYSTFNHVNLPFDKALFKESFQVVLGCHDFRGFCGRGSNVTDYERTIYKIAFEENEDNLIIHFIGDGFLRKMIRNLIGTALDISLGRKPKNAMHAALEEKNRSKGGRTASAYGLVLEEVFYTKEALEKSLASFY